MMNCLQLYKKEVDKELHSILEYWMQHTVDNIHGGFYGKVNDENIADENAPKGSVMHARILWAFSAAYNFCSDQKYFSTATRAFDYVKDHFIDKEYGGIYWTVDAKGNMSDTKKQIYAIAFCIYGLSEYYTVSKNYEALFIAIELYNSIEQHSYDIINKGYFEAFRRDWSTADDLRLSAKDANEKKTMNTHLHIIEAYSNLYKVYKNEDLRNKVIELLELFETHFIDHKTFHLKLFFDEQWNEKPNVISYGHDIEAAWLLQRCAEIIQYENWVNTYKDHAVKIADAAAEGLDQDGGLWYEYEASHHTLIKEKHWWPQSEAMIGFFNAWQITNDEKYLQHSINSWKFIKQYIIDRKKGEWFWAVKEDHGIMQNQDKAGIWKCPYHNSRACLEIINHIND
jgi:mannobiose 2-epimerase